jgi:hypothetical protein
MSINVSVTFDLETRAGQSLLARLQQLMLSDPPSVDAEGPSQSIGASAIAAGTAVEQLKANRQAAAANARAAKTKAGPVEKVPGPPEDLNGAGPEAQEDDIGLVDASSMSPGEARDAGLALVRQAYAGGHVAQVKALQKKWAIAKFYDVPVEKGHVFYQEAVKLAQSVGLSV